MQHKKDRFRNLVWKQFRKNKIAVASLYVLVALATVALLAPLIANEKPLYIKLNGENFFPAFSFKKSLTIKSVSRTEEINFASVDWKQLKYEKVLWSPIAYSPGKSDYANANFISPGGDQKFLLNGNETPMPKRFWHWLGTGNLGDDLLAGLIHGARISLTIGFISMGIASIIGILIGLLAGFFGDEKIIITRGKFLSIITGIFIAWFYAFEIRSNNLSSAMENGSVDFIFQFLFSILILSAIIFLFLKAGNFIGKIRFLNKKFHVPLDSILSRIIEIFVSLPVLLIIFTIAAISKPSLTNVMIIIGLTNWTTIARLTRAEMLRIRQLDYVQSAQALGFTNWRIIFKHALPNAIAPSLIAITFGIGNAILTESSLSFLGIGVPTDVVTWG
ncbi:MAG: ABC transporter permease, partial [Chitinophagales bacterium]|nr:ABC transporter permease [Chitinophagales bacterium]